MNKLIHGDNKEVLKQFTDNSIDAMVTDPPWFYKFMNSKWDYDLPSVDTFKECLRVLKPGAHILVCCGTRTQHRMTVNIEDAGFDIIDIVTHHYGNGFPKGGDISKKIDKAAGAEREIIGDGRYNARKVNGSRKFKNSLGLTTKPDYKETAPSTEEAKRYEGYSTTLKPATELWTLARKPISEDTIVKNILKWGTGAINIDDCRIATEETISNHSRGDDAAISKGKYGDSSAQETHQTQGQRLGRFPANLLFSHTDDCYEEKGEWKCADGCPVKILDEQAPQTGAYAMVQPGKSGNSKGIYGDYEQKAHGEDVFYDDGLLGASRFFYVAKPSREERNAGVSANHRSGALIEFAGKGAWHCTSCGRKYNYTAEVCPKCGSDNRILYNVGSRAIANTHVTVKPITLMRYLLKLIVPKNGTVLDPFAGSGTTGCAALMEQREFILIEKEKEYFEIATERIDYWKTQAMLKNQPSLFDTLL